MPTTTKQIDVRPSYHSCPECGMGDGKVGYHVMTARDSAILPVLAISPDAEDILAKRGEL